MRGRKTRYHSYIEGKYWPSHLVWYGFLFSELLVELDISFWSKFYILHHLFKLPFLIACFFLPFDWLCINRFKIIASQEFLAD